MQNIDIMGTHYEVKIISNVDEFSIFEDDKVGECDYLSKTIRIMPFDSNDKKVCLEFAKETVLHELAHAFICQTGNDDVDTERTAEIMAHFAKFVLKSEYKDQFISNFIREVDGYTKDVNK